MSVDFFNLLSVVCASGISLIMNKKRTLLLFYICLGFGLLGCSNSPLQASSIEHFGVEYKTFLLANFVQKNRIESWPRGEGPQDRDSHGQIVGLIVGISPEKNGKLPRYVTVPWCGVLHVPYKHKVLQWPEETGVLLPGKYVVAAQLVARSKGFPSGVIDIKILDVLGVAPDDKVTLVAALDRICSPENTEQDLTEIQKTSERTSNCQCR